MSEILLELKGVYKGFADVPVLQDINLEVREGEVHALLGENGAGKSTIIKTITGSYIKDEGQMFWDGEEVDIKTPADAMDLGISTIYQELNLIPELSVYENIFLGKELKLGKRLPFLDKKEMINKTAGYLKTLNQKIDPEVSIENLGMGQQQLIEISKAIAMEARLIIMDEPTSSLSEQEARQLLDIIKELKKQGITIIYISHRLEELKEITDRVTVLRDGKKIETVDTQETSMDRMVELMVGRELDEKFPKIESERGSEGLRVENLKLKDSEDSVSFTAYRGEILGFSGLIGAGRTEVARGVFGVDPTDDGKIFVDGKEVKIKNPNDAIRNGMAFITENRKSEGLILDESLVKNISLASLKHYTKGTLIQWNNIKKDSQNYIKELGVRPNNEEAIARNLSGGNQQKVVIAKWLATKAKVFIFDEPTRGIDVGAKVEVYRLINSLVEEGVTVIIISSELPEVLGMCDRILVMSEGKITGEFMSEEADQEKIMRAATGGN